jgi:hypothetical protein
MRYCINNQVLIHSHIKKESLKIIYKNRINAG